MGDGMGTVSSRGLRLSAVVLIGALAGGCTGGVSQADLAMACQFQSCVCRDANALFPGFAEKREVEWQANGNASCPEGFNLAPQAKES
jgi:hypothetical protein